jgi:hypothetical protein
LPRYTGDVSRATSLVIAAVAAAACGGDARPHAAGARDKLIAAISDAIGARAGAAVATVCPDLLPACFTKLPDGSALVSRIVETGSAWRWHVGGTIIAAAAVEAYVRDALADLGVASEVHCGPALRVVHPRERIECRLATGGAAWVGLGSDGRPSLELALGSAAATARGEVVAPDGEASLAAKSRAVAHLADDGDGDGDGDGDDDAAADAAAIDDGLADAGTIRAIPADAGASVGAVRRHRDAHR